MLNHQLKREYIPTLFFLTMLTIVSCFVWIQPFLHNQASVWEIEQVAVSEGYKPFKVEKVQLFLHDENGLPLTNSQVRLEAYSSYSEDSCKQWMHHLDQGLYEAECVFKSSGDWGAEVMIAGSQSKEKVQLSFHVQSLTLTNEPSPKRK